MKIIVSICSILSIMFFGAIAGANNIAPPKTSNVTAVLSALSALKGYAVAEQWLFVEIKSNPDEDVVSVLIGQEGGFPEINQAETQLKPYAVVSVKRHDIVIDQKMTRDGNSDIERAIVTGLSYAGYHLGYIPSSFWINCKHDGEDYIISFTENPQTIGGLSIINVKRSIVSFRGGR